MIVENPAMAVILLSNAMTKSVSIYRMLIFFFSFFLICAFIILRPLAFWEMLKVPSACKHKFIILLSNNYCTAKSHL